MSITSDLRSYVNTAADTAVSQGKQVLGTAQAQLNDMTGQANGYVGKAGDTAQDLLHAAEKAVNLDAITTAVEPYLAQLKDYTSSVQDKVEDFVSGVRNDKRVARLIDSAEPVLTAVLDTVNDRVVKPVQSLTGLGAAPATRSAAPSPAARKRAATKPAPAKAAPTKPAATKAAATKPAASRASASASTASTGRSATRTAPRKAPAKSTPKS